VGSFPRSTPGPRAQLHEWLETRSRPSSTATTRPIPTRPAAPYAVNQIVHRSNDRLMHDVEACVKFKVPIVITSAWARVPEVNEAIHSYGGIVLHDVINDMFARKAIRQGRRRADRRGLGRGRPCRPAVAISR
jgi:nitronate monooxygenase